MQELSDQKIVDCWQNNVRPWVAAVRDGAIESRVLVTNQSVVDAALRRRPATALDVGCGEGWLVRELNRSGINCVGVDPVAEFIQQARNEGGGTFLCLSMEELSGDMFAQKFDVVICNFSLLGKESVECFFCQAPALLNERGTLVVQTVHPVTACGKKPYVDGWRAGSWAGFDKSFRTPAPWYFRTMENWKHLFTACGLRLFETLEPVHPTTKVPVSVVFVGEQER